MEAGTASERLWGVNCESGEHLTFYPNISPLNPSLFDAPTESSSKFTASESDKLSILPGAPVYTTGTITSTRPTNFDPATTWTKRGHRRGFTPGTSSPWFSASNPQFGG